METATQALHRLTSFEPGQTEAVAMTPRGRNDFASNDLDRLPYFYKRYPQGLPTLALPRDLPTKAAPARAAGLRNAPHVVNEVAALLAETRTTGIPSPSDDDWAFGHG